jgi:hypothetical protein
MEDLKDSQEEKSSRIKRVGHFIAHSLSESARAYSTGGMSILFPDYRPWKTSRKKGLDNNDEHPTN